LDSPRPSVAALRASLANVSPVLDPTEGSPPVEPGTILWSEAYDPDWTAKAGGRSLEHVKPFGWSNGYELADEASVKIEYEGQLARFGTVAIQLALWIIVGVVWLRARAGARRGSTT
jgi:hypothetical protein